MIWQRSIACKDLAAELQSVETPWVFGARKSVVLQELNRQAKRQVALTAATGVAVRWGFGMFPMTVCVDTQLPVTISDCK